MLDLLTAVGGPQPERASRALRELLASYDQALAEPLRGWEALRPRSMPSNAKSCEPEGPQDLT